jgi:CBS domain-containing protein
MVACVLQCPAFGGHHMARFVREIMNPELFSVRVGVRSADVLDAILEFGISAVPVLDEERRPIGVASLRDLVREGTEPHIATPALSVGVDASVEDAGRIMAESGHHHLVVVGGDGRAVGMISSLDLLRATLGMPPKYPNTFPHYDAAMGVFWTDTAPFDVDHARTAPDGPGVLVLSMGGVRRSESDLWAEPTSALRARLIELLDAAPEEQSTLSPILKRHDLRFRCAAVADRALQASVSRRMRERIEGAPLPRDGALPDASSAPGRA